MAKKPRENRVPIMMADEELASVDDWRFANRIATRSDAIRRLCRLALVLDERLNEMWEKLFAFEGEAVRTLELLDTIDQPRFNDSQIRQEKARVRATRLEKAATDFDEHLRDLIAAVVSVRGPDSMDRILEQLKDLRALRLAQMEAARNADSLRVAAKLKGLPETLEKDDAVDDPSAE